MTLALGKELFYSLKIELNYTFVYYVHGSIFGHLGEFGFRWTKFIGSSHISFDIGFFGTMGLISGSFKLPANVTDITLEDGTKESFPEGSLSRLPGICKGGKIEVNLYYQLSPYFKIGASGGMRYTTSIDKISINNKKLSSEGQDELLNQLFNDEVDTIKTNFYGPFFNISVQGRI